MGKKKHPQNGPSFSDATYRDDLPLSDEELYLIHARENFRNAEARAKAARARAFDERIRKGGAIFQFTFNAGMGGSPEQSNPEAKHERVRYKTAKPASRKHAPSPRSNKRSRRVRRSK